MREARRLGAAAALLAMVAALGGCATPAPAGPSVMALPGAGKDLGAFQQDDAICRDYAAARIGYASPSQAATQSAVGSAAVGTALGAGAGALIGAAAGNAGAGAAIGAGTGLLTGSVAGANNAYASAGSVQAGYDIGYSQCMVARGDTVQPPPVPPGYPYYPGYAYAYPYPAYYGPSVAIGVGGGWGGWGWGGYRGYGWRGYGWRGYGWHH